MKKPGATPGFFIRSMTRSAAVHSAQLGKQATRGIFDKVQHVLEPLLAAVVRIRHVALAP